MTSVLSSVLIPEPVQSLYQRTFRFLERKGSQKKTHPKILGPFVNYFLQETYSDLEINKPGEKFRTRKGF